MYESKGVCWVQELTKVGNITDKFTGGRSLISIDHANGSSMHQAESLTSESDLVPTGSGKTAGERIHAGAAVHSGSAVPSWQTAMKRAIRSASVLRQRLNLPPESDQTEPDFPTFVPLELLSRIRVGDINDPILKQVLPVAAEQQSVPGFGSDPVGDLNSIKATGTLHKYHGRVLMITTGACGVHCRYCFRREFPYSDSSGVRQNWSASIDYIRSHEEVDEVLLSGGDPLTLADDKLSALIDQLEAIPHVRRLRIHSRMPIVVPQRVTDGLVRRLSESRLAVWMVVHANHPQECDAAVEAAFAKLINGGIPVLNQSVLLRGVNDDVDVLAELSRKLVNHRVQPYYLHQLDRVAGAVHFEVPVQDGLELVRQLTAKLPGYAVPTYVSEDSGEPSKTRLT